MALSDPDVTILCEKDGSIQKKNGDMKKFRQARKQSICQVYLFLSVTFDYFQLQMILNFIKPF